ncbi:flagellar hook-basal body complex protein [Acidomonas methanolica]|uniref:Flagellar hook protein FlgE n=1 Tax=Acidomonas methanolica NBRC 104435 TaxID=1231351 RepID=A0A023D7U4_ACIMT|nr:flagellar hook-basal body complex protein [Acidomonas methanolica]TCS25583.1 flagellar hook protein FlgE [Acidomonas methanolica]GAJ30169.1 flagellar hook protein FlgE [Acidomonas methanolica NBRC 104435]GBQ51856.1 flagellar hook protein FlgE [Acidomonas methanolica]GEK98708.1 flagellar hook protein FlgE [Acidomonas methanolica NBRC 104435]
MSIFGAINTAVSGLDAQSKAFSNLSNNIANSQTTGYKADTTAFENYVTGDEDFISAVGGDDSIKAMTIQHNDVQGAITSSTNSLAVAISGNGMFNVLQATGGANSASPVYNSQQYYTRNGDFSVNANGYLVNTSGDFLEGYAVGSTGSVAGTAAPIQVTGLNTPSPTTTLTLNAAIGDTAGDVSTNTSTATAYDASGNAVPVTLDWAQSGSNPLDWTVGVAGSGTTTPVTFNSDGSLASVGGSTSSGNASITVPATSTTEARAMTLDLGTIGSSNGVNLASSSAGVTSNPIMTTDSKTPTGVTITSAGLVEKTYSDGTTDPVAQIKLAMFTNANGLASTDGQNYTATPASGPVTYETVGAGAAGTLDTSSIEGSTTDLTGDLSNLIVAQQAYGANTKVVTTADQLMQTTIAMIQ